MAARRCRPGGGGGGGHGGHSAPARSSGRCPPQDELPAARLAEPAGQVGPKTGRDGGNLVTEPRSNRGGWGHLQAEGARTSHIRARARKRPRARARAPGSGEDRRRRGGGAGAGETLRASPPPPHSAPLRNAARPRARRKGAEGSGGGPSFVLRTKDQPLRLPGVPGKGPPALAPSPGAVGVEGGRGRGARIRAGTLGRGVGVQRGRGSWAYPSPSPGGFLASVHAGGCLQPGAGLPPRPPRGGGVMAVAPRPLARPGPDWTAQWGTRMHCDVRIGRRSERTKNPMLSRPLRPGRGSAGGASACKGFSGLPVLSFAHGLGTGKTWA